jgi:alpha-amylase
MAFISVLLLVLPFWVQFVLAASKDAWLSRSVYQLLTDRFASPTGAPCSDLHDYCGGTFKALELQLDYISAMGFDAVWISPVVDNVPGGYHGYWQRNQTQINSNFGAPADLASLSRALHERGMFLMVDVVANHASTNDVSQNWPFNTLEFYHDCNGCPGGCNVQVSVHKRASRARRPLTPTPDSTRAPGLPQSAANGALPPRWAQGL